MTLRQLIARARYVLSIALSRPNAQVLDQYFKAFPDAYDMVKNGPARMEALARAIEQHVGPCHSVLDVAAYEGYVLDYLAKRLAIRTLIGLDISEVVLQRAGDVCRAHDARFQAFDLTVLYDDPAQGLPAGVTACDLVLVCDVLFYVGANSYAVWNEPERELQRKKAFLAALQRYARKGMIVQHFGVRHRDAIGAVVEAMGGRLLNKEWGIYLLEGTAPAESSSRPAPELPSHGNA